MPPSPRQKARNAVRLQQIRDMLAKGWTYERIGKALVPPISKSGVAMAIRRAALPVHALAGGRLCALPECDVVFKPKQRNQKYCHYLHSKRGGERTRQGKEARWMTCRLPECSERVLVVDPTNPGKKFCCRTHGSRHDSRLRSGYYGRLVDRTACANCGFWGPGVERHHIKPKGKGGSDHPSNLVWLCWNCHRLVHSGLATINHRREFVDLREVVREGELARRSEWGEVH